MKNCYGATQIRDALEPLVMDKSIRFDHRSRLTTTLETYVATFDRDFKALPVRALEP